LKNYDKKSKLVIIHAVAVIFGTQKEIFFMHTTYVYASTCQRIAQPIAQRKETPPKNQIR